MDEKICPRCAAMLPRKAKMCPYCRKKIGWTLGAKLGLVVFILIGIPIWMGIYQGVSSLTKFDTGISGIDSMDVYIAATRFVEKRLSQPHTAKFAAHLASNFEKKNDNTFKISSYVDSQNSFGASIRNCFECTMKYMGNKKWNLLKIEIGGCV